jgi:VWFA-related protein
MNATRGAGAFLLCFSMSFLPVYAQQPEPTPNRQPLAAPTPLSNNGDLPLMLDVVVTDKSGRPVKDLEEKDFVVRDNGKPQKILSFRAISNDIAPAALHPPEPPVKIILLIDEVNVEFSKIAYERTQMKQFVDQSGGKLTHPVSLAFLTDTGTDMQDVATQDGSALLASFDKHVTNLRSIRQSAGFYGAVERFQLSVDTLTKMATKLSQEPGRKLVVWISPGWPLLSGPNIDLSAKQEQAIFSSIVSMSTLLRQARITVYSVDPLGMEDAGNGRLTYYQDFVKPVTQPKNALPANLGLQVLVKQTGGLVLTSSNDIGGQINRCFADADTYYTLMMAPLPAEKPNDFNAIDVKFETPGKIARTRNGYYAQP